MAQLVDRDGNVIEIADPAAAQAAVASGELGLRADREANLVDADGRVAVFDNAQDAASLLADPDSGFRLASDEEVQADIERAEYSDVGSQVAAGLEGVAAGATLGTSDLLVQGGLLGDEFAEDARKRAEHASTARTLGEGGGIIGSSLLTGGAAGGAGAVLKGARVASAPGRMAMGAGRAAEGLVSKALAKEGAGLGRQMLSKGAQLAAGGVVEGAAFGAGQALSQASLDRTVFEDPDLAAERIALGAKDGALIGGLVGAGTGAGLGLVQGAAGSLARSLKNAKGRAAQSVDDKAAREAAEEFTAHGDFTAAEQQRFVRQYKHNKKVLSGVATATDDDVVTLSRLAPEEKASTFGQRSTAAERLDDVRQDAIRTLSKHQDEIAVAADANRAAFNVSEKPEVIRNLIKKGEGPPAAVDKAASRKMAELEDKVQGLVSRSDDFESGGRSAIRQLGRATENSAMQLDDALRGLKGGDLTVESFRTLDRYKKLLGNAQVRASGGANGSQAAMIEIQTLREDLRAFLEAKDVWGPGIAGFQQNLNKKWAPLIDISSSFEYRFGTGRQASKTLSGMKSADDLTKVISESNPKLIAGLVNGLGRAETEKLEGLYRLKLARELEYQKAAHDLFGGGPKTAANIKKIEEASRKSLGSLDDARRTSLDAADFEAAQERLRSIPLAGETAAKARASAGRAAAFHETVEETIEETVSMEGSSVISGSFDAAGKYRKGAAVAQSEGGRSSIAKAATGVIDRVKGAAKGAAGAAKATARASSDAATYMGVKFKSDRDAAAYQELARRVTEMADPESDTRKDARDRMAPISANEPGLSQSIEGMAQRQADYLATKIAPTRNGPTDSTFSRTRPPRVSPADVRKLKRAVEAVENPQSVLDKAARGDLKRDDVEALKAVYPSVFRDLQETVKDELAEVDELPSYQDRMQLALLLDIPTDPSLEPEFIQRMQAGAQQGSQQAQQEQAGSSGAPAVTPGNAKTPSKTAEMYGTRTERLAGGM